MTAEQAALLESSTRDQTQLESSTRDQAQCKLWHQHRVGHVTALLFKSAIKNKFCNAITKPL